MNYIHDNIKYPKKQVDGPNCSYVTMVVEKDGSLTGIKILRASQGGPEFDAEALRVISTMPHFSPGTQNGNLVRVQLNLPVKFVSPSKK